MTLGQMFDSRPLPGWGSYRTPVAGLYLCGAGTHPGGGVIGAPGHNGAHALLRDEANGGWERSRVGVSSAVGKAPLLHRLMSRPGIRKMGVKLAQQPVVGKAADTFTKR